VANNDYSCKHEDEHTENLVAQGIPVRVERIKAKRMNRASHCSDNEYMYLHRADKNDNTKINTSGVPV